jgi:hypothetical protein
MIPNDQKRIFRENAPRDNKNDFPNKDQPLLNLQLYQKPPPPPQKKQTNFPFMAPNPYDPLEYAKFIQQVGYQIAPQITKEYQININGVSGSHMTNAMIFEDALPMKNVSSTMSSIGERKTLFEYIRSILFPLGDGNDVPIEKQANNLLSHLKFMDMNPYSAHRFSRNPYKGLPFGFLLYRSCYPIRHDSRRVSTVCAQGSSGINVRIYRLTDNAYEANKTRLENIQDFDEWREVLFYNYIKEFIIKKNASPNFPIMYGYNITLKSGINFDELLKLKDVQRRTLPSQESRINGGVYSGKVIVCLTEAPNYNLLNWARVEYRADGNVKRMINSGYHNKSSWESVLFQIMYALCCMQKNLLLINNFDPERNIFVKDINSGSIVTNYWKYIVDGIEYFIPNHGYLVMIDSNFRDFDIPIFGNEVDRDRERKLDGKFLDNNRLSDVEMQIRIFEMFQKSFDPNMFGPDFINDNGIRPPDDIMLLMSKIHNDSMNGGSYQISYYIRKYMTIFMNNRVGTLLNEAEKGNVRTGTIRNFKSGQIVVWTDDFGWNRFVVHVDTNDNSVSRIMTADIDDIQGKTITERDVPITSLNEYSITEPIRQNFKNNLPNPSEDNIIETYNI